MRIPTIRGIIDRRVLVNFRVDPDALSRILPAPFRPQLINGHGIAGICLIRLKHVRPKRFPAAFGISSENAAHRIAVHWDDDGRVGTGVFIPRRDTSSLLNAFAGGRIFPGVHHRALFKTRETENQFRIEMRSRDDATHVLVDGSTTEQLPDDSIFTSIAEVSKFFQDGSLGYSPQAGEGRFDGLELRTFDWQVEPLSIREVESSFFDDRDVFPEGCVTFDNALLMRGIDHEWHGRDALCCSEKTGLAG